MHISALEQSRWFAGKGVPFRGLEVIDVAPIPGISGYLGIAEVAFENGDRQRYSFPMVTGADDPLLEPASRSPFWRSLLCAVADGVSLQGTHGRFVPQSTPELTATWNGRRESRRLTTEQVNTSVVLGECVVLKLYRRLYQGPHPEIEMNAALRRVGSRRIPEYGGSLSYVGDDVRSTVVAFLQAFVGDSEDLWVEIQHLLQGRLTDPATCRREDLCDAIAAVEAGAEAIADIHRSLEEVFGVEVATEAVLGGWRSAGVESLRDALRRAEDPVLLEELRSAESVVDKALVRFLSIAPPTIGRVHGDPHASQMRRSREGVFVIDFEGDPLLPLAARRAPDSPIRDLASYVLSLDHIVSIVARAHGFDASDPALDRVVDALAGAAVSAYEATTRRPVDRDLLQLFCFERECRELRFSLSVLPEWTYAPRAALRRRIASESSAGSGKGE